MAERANLYAQGPTPGLPSALGDTTSAQHVKLGTYGNIEGSSAVNGLWGKWGHPQYRYGYNRDAAPTWHQFHGNIETDGMISVHARYGRWTPGNAPAGDPGHLFGGHVFEAWNSLGTYRLTMLIGKTGREDEACLFTFSPTSCFGEPLVAPTPEQTAARITRADEDKFLDDSYFGRVRIGSDMVNEGYLFQRIKMTGYGPIELVGARSNYIRVETPKTPASATDTGTVGTICWDSGYVYVCTATDTWKRAALSTW